MKPGGSRFRKIARISWLLAFCAAALALGLFVLVSAWASDLIRRPDGYVVERSPVLSLSFLATAGLFWLVTAWNARFLRGWVQGLVIGGLVLAVPVGFVMLLGISGTMPVKIASIRDRSGESVFLAIAPAWDVRSYQLYEPIWGGLAWRQRRDGGFTFWHYPYEGEMRLGLDRSGRAVLLNPFGQSPPFPDGLNTFPCPPGSSPRCLRHVREECVEAAPAESPNETIVPCRRTRRSETFTVTNSE